MSAFINIVGQRFGRLHVLRLAKQQHSKLKSWICLCSCGTKCTVRGDHLRRGEQVSCGCHRAEYASIHRRTHGLASTRLYRCWAAMLRRCRNPNVPAFKTYGGRGIKVCKTWQTFEPFRDWALASGYQDNLTIDRIDNDGNYTPSNCQWITLRQNISKRFAKDLS